MVSIIIDDFETDLSKWDSSTNWALDSANPHAGTCAAKYNNVNPHNLGLNVSLTGGKYTFDFYYRVNYTLGNVDLLNLSLNSGMNYICVLQKSNTALNYYDDTGTKQALPVPTAIAANTWYHIVIVLDFSDNSISWEVDGNSKGSINFTKDTWGETLDPYPPVANQIYFSGIGSSSISTYLDDVSITWESGVAGGSLVHLGRRVQKAILVR